MRDDALEPNVFDLKCLQPLRPLSLYAAILVAPAVVRLLADRHLLNDLRNRHHRSRASHQPREAC